MKNLVFLDESYYADKIIKTDTDIIGTDKVGNELFAFKGIKDFSLFKLENGEFDISEKTEIEQLKEEINQLKNKIEATE